MEEFNKVGKWEEKLPEILWSLRTTDKEVTGRTPFSLVFDTSVLPIEVIVQSLRLVDCEPEGNANNLKKVLTY